MNSLKLKVVKEIEYYNPSIEISIDPISLDYVISFSYLCSDCAGRASRCVSCSDGRKINVYSSLYDLKKELGEDLGSKISSVLNSLQAENKLP